MKRIRPVDDKENKIERLINKEKRKKKKEMRYSAIRNRAVLARRRCTQ
jgi:hypothetical protein